MSRPLRVVDVPPGRAALDALLPALASALDGTGPAVVPVPPGVEGQRVRTAVRPDEPVDDAVAVVVATSGSTGEPKGVMLTAEALLASARATLDRLGVGAASSAPGARWLLAMPGHRIGGVQVLVRSLLAGTTPEVLDLSGGFRAHHVTEATRRLVRRASDGPRATALVPTQLVRLLDADGDGGSDAVEALRAYDTVLLGGAAAPARLLDRARALGVRVVTTYGMSETGGGCVYDGVPLDGVRVRLGDEGRIALGGPVVFSGYRGRDDLTEAALTVADGVRWHLTHDLGRLDPDRRLTVLGRADDVIVSGGENVPAGAVEDALCSHPGVRECAVVGREDAEWGERVVGVVVPTDPASPPGLDALRAHVSSRLGPRAAPRTVEIVAALPLLPSGKVDRQALRER